MLALSLRSSSDAKRDCALPCCAATGGSFSVAAGRLSFTYGLKGPAVSIDTACSSALVATHMAVAHLRARPGQPSLAAGVNLMLSEATSAAATAAGMLTMVRACREAAAHAELLTGSSDKTAFDWCRTAAARR